jgi:hypothetical protein
VQSFAREKQQWVVQPLLDVGLDPGQIRDLVFRLAFQDVVSEGRDTLRWVTEVVTDQPVEVQTAWAQTIARMLTVEFPP